MSKRQIFSALGSVEKSEGSKKVEGGGLAKTEPVHEKFLCSGSFRVIQGGGHISSTSV